VTDRSGFEIRARAGRARAGVLLTPHGEVRTPAFVPLATTGAVKGLQAAEVEALGFEMLLGNTFHLLIRPGADSVARMGGLHEFMGWRRPIITDSGGFQVFSMGHGTVAEELKGSRAGRRSDGRVLSIDEEGVRFRSYLDGEERFLGPETSLAVQAALGSDVALAFDECTPYHISRDYTAHSTERTHRWLDRCVEWHARHAPAGQLLYGIVQGGVYDDLRERSARRVAESGAGGVAIGGSLGREKAQMRAVLDVATRSLPEELPRHGLGIGDPDDLLAGVRLGIDTFDCATPTRLARHGTALVPDPAARWRVDLTRASERERREPIAAGCPCPACREHTRGYLHYLARAGELTAVRLLALHNLIFMARLMDGLRLAVEEETLDAYADALERGDEPYGAATSAARRPVAVAGARSGSEGGAGGPT
jgi:queuine tRNA-ribosyltransferase